MKRNPWPFGIVIFFGVFITAMVSWICFAVRNDHELVRRDYYEQELQFQGELDRIQRSKDVKVFVTYDSSKNRVQVELPSDISAALVHFYRPASASLDKIVPLTLESGSQSIDVRHFEAGLWRVQLSWKANDSEYQHDESFVFVPTKLSSL